MNPFSIIEIILWQPGLEFLQSICDLRLPVQGSSPQLFQSVLPPDYGPMLFLEAPSHPYFLPLVENTIVGLPHPFGKLLQGEFCLLQADWGFTRCTAQVRRIVVLIICIKIVIGNLGQRGQVHYPCDSCFLRFRRRQEWFHWEADGRSRMCARRRCRWRSRAGRCWPMNWIVSRRSWRHSWCTWRWRPLPWELLLENHSRLAITALVEVISLPRWPITWIFLAYAGGWLGNVCHVKWRMVIKLQSAWKWLLWRRVTIPMWQLILICVFPTSTVFASGRSFTIVRASWIVVTALLRAKYATRWSHIRCPRFRSLRRHVLWTKIVVNYYRCTMWYTMNWSMVEYIANSSDLWRNDGLHISYSVVTNCGVSLHLWSMQPTWALRKRYLNHTHPAFLCYMLEFIH